METFLCWSEQAYALDLNGLINANKISEKYFFVIQSK